MAGPGRHRLTVFVLSVAIAALLALAPAAARGATITPPPALTPSGRSVQAVNNGPVDQLDPHISSSLISYTDFSSGSGQIRYHDLGTGSDKAIPQRRD